MPNENKTLIYILTDRSGSMQSIRNDVIGGFNAFLKDQQSEPGECLMTYAQFDNEYEELFANEDIHNVRELTEETFVPRGGTALLDAWGRSMISLKNSIGMMDEKDRPGKVIFVVITDGEENASREFRRSQIFDMVKTAEESGWNFTFLAANQDAVAEGIRYGIRPAAAMSFSAYSDDGSVGETYSSVSRGISNIRRGFTGGLSYDKMDRLRAMKGSNAKVDEDDKDDDNS